MVIITRILIIAGIVIVTKLEMIAVQFMFIVIGWAGWKTFNGENQ